MPIVVTCARCGKQRTRPPSAAHYRCSKACGYKPLAERFWAKVEKSDGCWLWTGTHQVPHGYGWIKVNDIRVRAHRVSWELHNGPIPEGMLVLHRCDNPACVNPAHLFLGTHQDNMDDMIRKGRARHPPNRRALKLRVQGAPKP